MFEKNGQNKYLIFSSTERNRMMLQYYLNILTMLKNKLN